MNVYLAAQILLRHNKTLGDLLLADPPAVNLTDGTVDRDRLACFLHWQIPYQIS